MYAVPMGGVNSVSHAVNRAPAKNKTHYVSYLRQFYDNDWLVYTFTLYMYVYTCTMYMVYIYMYMLTFTLIEQTAVETKQQTKTKSDHKISSESKANETVPSASEKDSDKEVSSKGNAGSGAKRRRSEDELELHPTIDWEEEGAEGGKEGGERSTSHKQSRRIGDKSSRRGRGETKAINAVRRGEGEGKSRKERSGLEEKKEETDELHVNVHAPAIKHTRAVKVSVIHVYVHVQYIVHVRVHSALPMIKLSILIQCSAQCTLYVHEVHALYLCNCP